MDCVAYLDFQGTECIYHLYISSFTEICFVFSQISSKELEVKIPVVIGNVPLRMERHTTYSESAEAPPYFEELPAIAEDIETKEGLPE